MTGYCNKEQVHNRAIAAIGKTLQELNGGVSLVDSAHKSGAGDAWEKWFGKLKDSESAPDILFPDGKSGVELKATPIKRLKVKKNEGTPRFSAKERLVLNIINYNEVVKEEFESSHFLFKNGTIELAFYEWSKDTYKDNFKIENVALFEMMRNPVDAKIIRKDWHIIDEYIKAGKAHELSERLTTYLSACTKGASSKSVRQQPFSDIPAKQRAYSLKSGYMTYLYNTYVLGIEKSESIIIEPFELEKNTLEEIILEKINPFIGKSQRELCEQFGVKANTKSTSPEILKHILGLKNNVEKSQEFMKAGIKPKSVSVIKGQEELKEEFKIQEYKFADVCAEEGWEDSELHDFLDNTKFLISVWEMQAKNDKNPILVGAKFWSMPENDVEKEAREVYEDTVFKIKSGVEITWTPHRRLTNFIKSSPEMKLFSKLSAGQTSYSEVHADGRHYSEKLPVKIKWINRPIDKIEEYSDWYMTKQAWWLNKKYMYEQVKDIFSS